MMPGSNRPRFEQLFVVLRIDDFAEGRSVEDRISAVSVFRSHAQAVGETERLAALPSAKRSRYVVLTSRLKGEPPSDG